MGKRKIKKPNLKIVEDVPQETKPFVDAHVGGEVPFGTSFVRYALYYDPLDFPGEWVMRRWFLGGMRADFEEKPEMGCVHSKNLSDVMFYVPHDAKPVPLRKTHDEKIKNIWQRAVYSRIKNVYSRKEAK